MLVSIVVPAYNERENIPEFVRLCDKMIKNAPFDGELIIVDDGSTDGTGEVSEKSAKEYSFVRVFHHTRNRGLTAALETGFSEAKGEILIFFPADLQYLPEEIPRMIETMEREKLDIVCGWKEGRYKKRLVSSVYNYLVRKFFDIEIHDMNSVKAFRREVVEAIPFRKDWHRYVIPFAADAGFRIGEVRVKLHERHWGESKFKGPSRVIIGVLDLLAVKFQITFMKRPMIFFGTIGMILLLLGFMAGIAAVVLRFGYGIGYRPLLYLIMLLVLSGMLLFIVGFLSEAIAGVNSRLSSIEKRLKKKE
ncbi:glycosyltransferase family 2 protein [bacterium]|nr:glycosyltransferase family 2 protein [bacterium]